jgi:hypothetical protein
MNRPLLRRAVAVLTVVTIVVGSLTAQALETRIAGRIAAPSTQSPPSHTCTPTLCYINPPRHLTGGWPDPFLPALLLGAGLLGAVAWIRLSPGAKPTGAQTMQNPRMPRERPSTVVESSPDADHKDISVLRHRFPRPRIGQVALRRASSSWKSG